MRLLGLTAALAAFALAGVLLVPGLFGYHRFVVVSDSMTGTYDRGSVVFSKLQPRESLKSGDVITFTPPTGGDLVTHRIVAAAVRPDGVPAFKTKGDANQVKDPWAFSPTVPQLPVATGSIPYLGYVIAFLDLALVRLLLIALPALLIAVALINSIVREGRERPIRTTGWSA